MVRLYSTFLADTSTTAFLMTSPILALRVGSRFFLLSLMLRIYWYFCVLFTYSFISMSRTELISVLIFSKFYRLPASISLIFSWGSLGCSMVVCRRLRRDMRYLLWEAGRRDISCM